MKKVSRRHSMMARIVSLFLGGVALTAFLLMVVSLRQNQRNVRSLVQSYLLTTAEEGGYLLDTVIVMQGDEVLEQPELLEEMIGNTSVNGMESSYAYLVAPDRTMLYHPTAEKIGQPVENEVVTKLAEDLSAGTVAEPECVEYDFKGTTKYAAYYIHPEGKYILVVSADEDEAFQAVTETRNTMTAMSLALLAVFAVAGCLIIKRMVKPLHTLSNVVERVAELDLGELSEQEYKLTKQKDEIGMMANSILHLHAELREIIGDIQQQGEKLSESNQQFAKGFSQIIQTVDNVNVAVEEIATGSTSQAQETSTAGAHISDIGNAIESNTTSVSSLEDSIQKMNTLAVASSDMLEELAKINTWTAETINAVTEQTDRTNQSAQRINEAVVAIQDIASQTNLLSLNASIEAARAGESGRGFAVVAEQIRKLAEDSAGSAEQIEAIVGELIANSADGVAKMQELSDNSKVQAERLSQTKTSFDDLKTEIDSVSAASGEIFTQTNAINQLKNGVNSVIEQLAAIAEENAASTQETSASMCTLSENLDRCKDETDVLSDLSAQLSEQTAKFRF